MAAQLEEEEMLPRTPPMRPGFDPSDVDLARGEPPQHLEQAAGAVLQGEEERRLVPSAGFRSARAQHEKPARAVRRVLGGILHDRETERLRHDRRRQAERLLILTGQRSRFLASRGGTDLHAGRQGGGPSLAACQRTRMRVEPLRRALKSQGLVSGHVHELRDDLDLRREEEIEGVEGGVLWIALHREHAVFQPLRLDPLEKVLRRGDGLEGRGFPEPPHHRLMRETAGLPEVADAESALQRARRGEDLAEDRLEAGEGERAPVLTLEPLDEVALAGRVQRGLSGLALARAYRGGHLRALRQEPDQLAVDPVDAGAQIAEVSHGAWPLAWAAPGVRSPAGAVAAPRSGARATRHGSGASSFPPGAPRAGWVRTGHAEAASHGAPLLARGAGSRASSLPRSAPEACPGHAPLLRAARGRVRPRPRRWSPH